MTPSEGQDLTLNFDFRGYVLTFGAQSTPKSWSLKAENSAQTTPEQV